jgi:hypothetical protein
VDVTGAKALIRRLDRIVPKFISRVDEVDARMLTRGFHGQEGLGSPIKETGGQGWRGKGFMVRLME